MDGEVVCRSGPRRAVGPCALTCSWVGTEITVWLILWATGTSPTWRSAIRWCECTESLRLRSGRGCCSWFSVSVQPVQTTKSLLLICKKAAFRVFFALVFLRGLLAMIRLYHSSRTIITAFMFIFNTNFLCTSEQRGIWWGNTGWKRNDRLYVNNEYKLTLCLTKQYWRTWYSPQNVVSCITCARFLSIPRVRY